MPVSSPSYFPPSRGTDQIVGITAGRGQTGARVFLGGQGAGDYTQVSDLILIGDTVLSSGTVGAPVTDAGIANTVIVGSRSLPNAPDCTTDILAGLQGSIVIVGGGNFPLALAGNRMAGTICVGAGIANLFTGSTGADNFARNILIGDNVWQGNALDAGFGSADNILIGYLVGLSNGTHVQWNNNIVIGSQAGKALAGSISNNVILGHKACNALSGSASLNVVIGHQAAQSLGTTSSNVIIGYNTSLQNPPNGENVIVGASSGLSTGDHNTVIGAANAQLASGSRNIVLGHGADVDLVAATSDQFVIGTYDGATKRFGLFGNLNTGNLILGNSSSTNRDFDGVNSRNIVKLLNGTVGALAPVGGGYFYVTAGALHWVGSAGTDTPIAPA